MSHPLQSLALRADWTAVVEPFKHTWCELGNIDQFRWLSRADVQRHLVMARDEIGVRHVRAAAMYGPEMRVWGRPLPLWNDPERKNHREANWQMIDLTIEQLLELGLKPLYTTCFTPPGFSDSHETCWPDQNPIGLPRDLSQWSDFVEAGLRHHIKRFGREEMRSWYFECWNEPNLSGFFAGSKEDFFRLWSATWRAVKSADPEFRFGGPSTARGEWVPEFLEWAQADGTMPDYLVTHVYNNDSDSTPLSPFDGPASHRVKDSPHFASGVIRGMREELDQRGFSGEVHWNEWGRSWFPHDPQREGGLESAFIVKTMAESSQSADQFAFWCLSDIYDQIGFQSAEFQGHYGLLSLHGLRKPGWFAHMLLNRLETGRVPVTGGTELVNAIATRSSHRQSLLLYAYPDRDRPHSEVEVAITTPPGSTSATLTRLDASSNNIIHQWTQIGMPDSPTPAQIAALRAGNSLITEMAPCGGHEVLHLKNPCPGVCLVEFS